MTLLSMIASQRRLMTMSTSSAVSAKCNKTGIVRCMNNMDKHVKLLRRTFSVTSSTMHPSSTIRPALTTGELKPSSTASLHNSNQMYNSMMPSNLQQHQYDSSSNINRWLSTTTTTTTTPNGDSDDDDKNNKSISDATSDDIDDSPTPSVTLKNQKTMEFQAETKQLLDIVTNSLYTEKDVFLRELISNASDALEKMRHYQQLSSSTTTTTSSSEGIVGEPPLPLEINITLDEVESSITIKDTGIGMTSEELIDNLGTIAKSGSKQFMAQLAEASIENAGSDPEAVRNSIIGRFGVGFYSVFMVAHKVEVTTKSQISKDDNKVTVWTSDGTGTYELAELDEAENDGLRIDRGTSIKIFLDSDYWHLLSEPKIKETLQKYSNFVQFPIYLNGSLVNTIQAVWSMDPKEVEYDTYVDFYKYIANGAIDDPLEILHFRADAPIDIQALLFIPSFHTEKYGMERMTPGVSLYSRKVLIEGKGQSDILPDWLRFVKGVVDSQDLPLSISREKPQDSALIAKLRKAVTRRFLSQLEKMAKYVPFLQMRNYNRGDDAIRI
jgi:HSP90 family molecular chaperone